MHLARRASALALGLLATACAAPEPSSFRRAAPREALTIFSPLDLPTPGSTRNGAGAPGPDYWQQRADYTIRARFDPDTRRVEASGRVVYTNASPDPLDYLWIQLEQNVFRPDSLGARLGPRGAIAVTGAEGAGYTLGRARAGDDELPISVYDTLGRLDLPGPLAPGAQLAFDLDWSMTLPETTFRRFGIEQVADGTIFEVAQWFPALAVYDDVHGWNTLPYLGTGEFYSDYGDYLVELTVPREYVVVAGGELLNPEQVFTPEQAARLAAARDSADTVTIIGPDEVHQRPEGSGDLTWRFAAHDVRTFAWAASDAFQLDAAGLDGVLLQSAYPAEAAPVWKDATAMLRTAMADFNARWHPYPWPVATNVCGAEGGMEYPMIIFCGQREDADSLYGLTAHEIGHNWFPMLVNTDERRHAWMDEGFNTFIDVYAHEAWFGEFPADDSALPRNFAQTMRAPDLLPVETPPDRLPRRLLGQLEYRKTAAGLILLREEVLGHERFDHAFRTYIRRWAFRSPRPADFYRSMEDAAGVDLAWFWRGWFQETSWLDQALGAVTYDPDAASLSVEVVNRGELVMPVTLDIELVDGSTLQRRLPVEVWGHDQRLSESFDTAVAPRRVTLDAHQGLPDVDRDNNTWSADD